MSHSTNSAWRNSQAVDAAEMLDSLRHIYDEIGMTVAQDAAVVYMPVYSTAWLFRAHFGRFFKRRIRSAWWTIPKAMIEEWKGGPGERILSG